MLQAMQQHLATALHQQSHPQTQHSIENYNVLGSSSTLLTSRQVAMSKTLPAFRASCADCHRQCGHEVFRAAPVSMTLTPSMTNSVLVLLFADYAMAVT